MMIIIITPTYSIVLYISPLIERKCALRYLLVRLSSTLREKETKITIQITIQFDKNSILPSSNPITFHVLFFFFHLSFQKAHPTLNGQFFADRTIRRNPRKMFWRLRERKRRKKGGGEKRREKKKPEQEKRLTLDGFRGRFNGKEHFCSDDERSWQIFSSLSPSISLRPFFFTSSFFFFLTTKR